MDDTEMSVTEKEAQWKQFQVATTELKEGEDRYLVTLMWFSRWRGFVQGKISDKPPPIDNNFLEQEKYRDERIEPLNQAQWSMLSKWYGGGPEIQRKVLRDEKGKLFVETKPWELTVEYDNKSITLLCSRGITCWDLFALAVKRFDGLTTENSRMIRKHSHLTWTIEEYDIDLLSAGLRNWDYLEMITF